ncbi:MAG: hypothetical protein PVI30_02715 [Myxococcales bacterium]|jgi:hypothetical protein
MPRIPTLLVAATLFVACTSDNAIAHPRGRYAPYVVTVEDAHGRELPAYHHGGQTFVLGHFGDRYVVRIQNRTGRRVEAVVSVDGRDVITGRVGDYVHGRGYIVAPYSEVRIEGFRQSLSRVASFRFSRPAESYSARMGTPQNVGVIGVAVFPERIPPRPRPYVRRDLREHTPRAESRARPPRTTASPRGDLDSGSSTSEGGRARSAPARKHRRGSGAEEPTADRELHAQNLGTEYGESRHNRAREVRFRRQHPTRPTQLITLRYDDRRGLLARGVRLSPPPRPAYATPEPFPESRFAPPPPPY